MFYTTVGNYLKTTDYNITHSNIVSSLNAKANLSGAIFTGNITAPIVDAFNLRENCTNINTIYAYVPQGIYRFYYLPFCNT